MTWISGRLEQRKKLIDRRNAVANNAENLFGELWIAIITCTTEAKASGLAVETNGTSLERVVAACTPPDPHKRKELRIKLDKYGEKVTVSESGRETEFLIDVCDDGVICLKLDGKQVTIQDAARLILDPFLFPDLQSENPN